MFGVNTCQTRLYHAYGGLLFSLSCGLYVASSCMGSQSPSFGKSQPFGESTLSMVPSRELPRPYLRGHYRTALASPRAAPRSPRLRRRGRRRRRRRPSCPTPRAPGLARRTKSRLVFAIENRDELDSPPKATTRNAFLRSLDAHRRAHVARHQPNHHHLPTCF